MSLTLKTYQENALAVLTAYLQRAQGISVGNAFYTLTDELEGQGRAYLNVPGFPGMPYVCLRIPTGGGKTLLAAHAVGLITHELLHTDQSVVLWLAPTTQIVEQTLKALRDHHHPYREALEAGLNGRPVEVLDLTEALYLTRGTLGSSTVVIVGTLAALRVTEQNTAARKFYESNGALQHHFTGLADEDLARLERNENGVLPASLANVLRLRRPVVIMDEAHNARTPLSFETLIRLSPSIVLELTATPATEHRPERSLYASNVLYSVSAYQLKAEEMVKLPIVLQTNPDHREVIAQAIAQRDRLEEEARREREVSGEYLRPIVLFQAQSAAAGQERQTPDVLKRLLVEDFQIPEEQIAIATGTHNDLAGVDLNAEDCAIRHVITVQALREGWDCPFAYVLCSVSNVASSTAIEQLLGRVLRLPGARLKSLADLNRSYAFVTSDNFGGTVNALSEGLTQNGFEAFEARQVIEQGLPFSGGGPPTPTAPLFQTPSVRVSAPVNVGALPSTVRDRFEYDAGRGEVRFRGERMTEEDRDALRLALPEPDQHVAQELFDRLRAAPSERNVTFRVPRLTVMKGQERLPFEASLFLDGPWPLSTYPAALTEAEFSLTPRASNTTVIDVTQAGRVQAQFVPEVQQQLLRLVDRRDWTPPKLALWLDRNIPHPDVVSRESTSFILAAVEELIATRGVDVNVLAREKYRLRDALSRKIEAHRQTARAQGYQSLLLGAVVDEDPAFAFSYGPQYPASYLYSGTYRFHKHYYPVVGELKSQGEEFDFATFLDMLPEVKHWVRNLERQPRHSFWIQTSTDRFYPDFVAHLHDGRVLVVEYKGADRISNDDSREKRRLGELWAERSGGRALFAIVTAGETYKVREVMRA